MTGGHRGFGRAVVDELLERGAAKVYASSRSEQPHRDPRIVPLILGLTDDASVAAAAQAAPDVSILVNNAGVLLVTPVLEAPLPALHDELETKLFGIIRVTRAFAPILAAHPPSSIVNVLSVLSWMTLGTGYEISKAAAWSATNALRLALRARATTVTALHVAFMDTDVAARFDAPEDRAARGRPPDGRRDHRRRLRDPRRRHDPIGQIAPLPGRHRSLRTAQHRLTEISEFRVEVPDAAIRDLHSRIQAARWPEKEPVSDRTHGVPLAELRSFVEYWSSGYDWRRLEAEINSFGSYRTLLDGLKVHFIHAESPHANALPLILTHGWPESIVEFLDCIAPLIDPVKYGGTTEDAFHVVVPSLPGFGFSDRPREPGWNYLRIARAWRERMNRLAMDMRFAACGKAVLAQPEVGVGIIPGGEGTQRLTHLVGRERALEIILGCNDIDADLAERWGHVNRALQQNQLRPFVDALARRIASFPPDAIAHAKAAVTAAEPDMLPGLLDEAHRFAQRTTAEEAITRMQRFLELGEQTREFELDAYNPDQPGDD